MIEVLPAALTAGPLLLIGGRAAVHNGRTAVELSPNPLHVHMVRAVARERGARVLDVVTCPGHVAWRAGRAVRPVTAYRRRLAKARAYRPLHGAVAR